MDVRQMTRTAQVLVSARRTATPVAAYPGDIPATMRDAYQIQELAIALWGEDIAGWKVGLVRPDWRDRAQAERLVGPIFAPNVWPESGDGSTWLPVIVGGTACVEAELVLEVGCPIDPGARTWTRAEALRCLGRIRPGVELAGSPVPNLNALGPMAVASDFGNNAGLLVGPDGPAELETWADIEFRTWVNGSLIGAATVVTVPGGPLESFRFALETITARGHSLRAGDLIATGAVTGVHDVVAGQSAHLEFGDLFGVDVGFVG